jgi:hypothetical protein
MTLLQNIRPRMLLTPLVESLCREVLGVPDVDSNTRDKIAELVANYERQHSFFQTADVNARRVLVPALEELVDFLRKNEESLVANSATVGCNPQPRSLAPILTDSVGLCGGCTGGHACRHSR